MSGRLYSTSLVPESDDPRTPASPVSGRRAPRRRWRAVMTLALLGLMALSQLPTTALANTYGYYFRP
jgi:hypothetical protein